MLHQVSYQELKSLVLQYPYSPNLRYLLLLKSLLDKSKDFDKNQVMASLSSPDRKKLRTLVKQYTRLREMQENYALSEEFLELKDLSLLDSLEEAAQAAANAGSNQIGAAVPSNIEQTANDGLDEEVADESSFSFLNDILDNDPSIFSDSETAGTTVETEDLTASSLANEILQSEAPTVSEDEIADSGFEELPIFNEVPPKQTITVAVVSEPEDTASGPKGHDLPLEITNEPAPPQPTPKPKSSFNSWLRQLNPPQAGMLQTELRDISLNSKYLHQEEPVKEVVAKQIADQSVEEDVEIASETLAVLLEKQKHYAKAIAMYRRLSLQNPEKSSLFAAKIEELNKKL